ncbi:MAG: hypothetical protein WEA80_02995 [Gemmatimonadaceae bacterium]
MNNGVPHLGHDSEPAGNIARIVVPLFSVFELRRYGFYLGESFVR